MSNKTKAIGKAISRIDGVLKVTGRANYSLDFAVKNAAYGFLIKSEIASGKILDIDTKSAEKTEGVIAVITHKNALNLKNTRRMRGGAILQDENVRYFGENIGIIIAETFEQARHAANLVKVTYQKSEAKTDLNKLETLAAKSKSRQDKIKGDVEKAYSKAEIKLEETYVTPIEHHHTMAPHSTIAIWENDEKVLVYNESQVVRGIQASVSLAFGLLRKNVRVISPHIGGGFGAKGGAWGHVAICVMAAKMIKRPVRLALTRQMMFNSVGLRQKNIQRIKLASTKDGKLTSLAHETTTHTPVDQEFIESCGDISEKMYDVPNLKTSYKVAPMNIILPTYMRAPGKSTGSFALESAIDELAYKLKIDPIEFRLKNEPTKDPTSGKPFSSRSLIECMQAGAKKIGWNKRKFEPRQNQVDDYLIGYGLGCGTYPARQRFTSTLVKLKKDGDDVKATIELGASDLGTGTYTIVAQVAAETLGLPVIKVGVRIGDSNLPPAAGSVGSVGAASFSNAVFECCEKVLEDLQAKTNTEWFAKPTILQLMKAANLNDFQTKTDTRPLEETKNYSAHAFGANFAEAWVSESTGMVKVKRFVTATGAGQILNPQTAESQMHGGVIWGIGQALTEESEIDPRWGNFVTRTLADYHIPANLDIGEIETIFIDEKDKYVNKLGVKGIGEVGIVGVAAAISNAIFNATGKRIRNLPITPDKLI